MAQFDKVITWGDATTEHWKIGDDGYFYLNGNKQRLIGMDIGTTGFSPGDFWDEAHLTILNKEMAYLATQGVRLVHMNLISGVGTGNEAARYGAVLDLCYDNKMLVAPLITGKWLAGFDNLTTLDYDVVADPQYTLSEWVTAWCAVVDNYDNVVAIVVENEIDLRLEEPEVPVTQEYTAQAASDYMDYLVGLIEAAIPDRPTVTKLMQYFDEGIADAIKVAVADSVDIIGWTSYKATAAALSIDLRDTLLPWLTTNGYSTKGWWMTEINAANQITANFDSDFITECFEHGAACVILWVGHREQELTAAFFDAAGDEVATLTAIAADFAAIQASKTLVMELEASKDTNLDAYNNTTNYGSITYSYAQGRALNIKRTITEFDITDLIALGAVTLVSAVFQLYYYAWDYKDPVGTTTWAYKLSRTDWVELQATWNIYKTGSNWTAGGGDYVTSSPAGGSVAVPAAYGYMDYNVLAIVQDAFDASANVELLTKYEDETLNETDRSGITLRTRDHTTVTEKPWLNIRYIPIATVKAPGSVALPLMTGGVL